MNHQPCTVSCLLSGICQLKQELTLVQELANSHHVTLKLRQPCWSMNVGINTPKSEKRTWPSWEHVNAAWVQSPVWCPAVFTGSRPRLSPADCSDSLSSEVTGQELELAPQLTELTKLSSSNCAPYSFGATFKLLEVSKNKVLVGI